MRLFSYIWGSTADEEDSIDSDDNDQDVGDEASEDEAQDEGVEEDSGIQPAAAAAADIDHEEDGADDKLPARNIVEDLYSMDQAVDSLRDSSDEITGADTTKIISGDVNAEPNLVGEAADANAMNVPDDPIASKVTETQDVSTTVHEIITVAEGADEPNGMDHQMNPVKDPIATAVNDTLGQNTVFEQITDDLVIPQTIPPSQQHDEEVSTTETIEQEIQREDDVYPKAQEFLAEISVTDEDETIPPEKAAQIIGFDDDETRTVYTQKTCATSVSRRVPASSLNNSSNFEEGKKQEHQSLFDILDRNFQELGDGGVGYKEVKLCFVAFVVVFAPADALVNGVDENNNAELNSQAQDDNNEEEDVSKESAKSQPPSPKKVSRPNVPLSVAFALWRKVLRLKGDESTTLSYVRSTLVLLGLLELSTIDREDAPIPSATTAPMRSRHPVKSTGIECLRLHHDINQQYGEYLAYGDHADSFQSIIERNGRQWNNAVMEEVDAMGSNEYTIRMLPLNTMRAYHMQDTFDLLKDKSFVRRRVRLLGAFEAASALIRDIDELLRLIDQRVQSNDSEWELVDEQDGVLSAFDQMKKYCLHITNELTKHTAPGEETEDNTESVKAAAFDKTTLSKIRDVGKAIHLLGTSLGGYGFFDQEMDYYNEALRLKELCARSKLDHVSISDTLHCMGFSLDNAGKSEEALEYYDRALDLRYEYLGDDDLRVAETLHNKVRFDMHFLIKYYKDVFSRSAL
jgi:tetratricopeptide (TPR) repeat protein